MTRKTRGTEERKGVQGKSEEKGERKAFEGLKDWQETDGWKLKMTSWSRERNVSGSNTVRKDLPWWLLSRRQ